MSSRSPSPPATTHQAFRVALDSELAPEQAVVWLRGERRPFALAGDWLGGGALLGSEPLRVADAADDPFAVLADQPGVGAGAALVGGGWIGWLGYGLGARIERLAPSPPAPVTRAPFSLAFYDHVVLFDGQRWWFEGLWTPARDHALRERLALWTARLRTEPPAAPTVAPPTPFALAGNGASGHVSAVAQCRERIAAGEVFQANVCLRLDACFTGDPVDLFARALPRARPRFGAFMDGLVSLSPERFLRREGRSVQAEPIKGTRPRVGSEHERRAALDELLQSGKDAAEHVMIVDLMRNDLGRVCSFGTISAAPARAEPHASVWHLVTTVSGQLREHVGDDELLRATFPPGSVTGAPKVQAMKVIAELEATRRETYTGAIGIASPIAGLDLAVAIRTFEIEGDRIWLGAGGGIVSDSDPELELAEALAKAAGPIAAIGGRLARPGRRPAVPHPTVRRALRYGDRPDPACGVFETVLVRDGRPAHLEAHLDRLAHSLDALYGARPDGRTAERARAAAATAGQGCSRMRLLADPDGAVAVTCTATQTRRGSQALLVPFVLPGGLGAHKWRDRRLVDALAASTGGPTALLVDTDGAVLEAAYANVWIVEQDALITPPSDGRFLAGITRSTLLDAEPSAREEPVTLTRLRRADRIFLTSSISGRHAARVVDCEAALGGRRPASLAGSGA